MDNCFDFQTRLSTNMMNVIVSVYVKSNVDIMKAISKLQTKVKTISGVFYRTNVVKAAYACLLQLLFFHVFYGCVHDS